MSFWKNVIWVGTAHPGLAPGGDPYSLKMPPAPQSSQAALVQSVMAAGVKSIVFLEISTFSVFHMQPSHQSSDGVPVFSPTKAAIPTEAEGRLALQAETVNGPERPPSTSVHSMSAPSEQ